MLGTPKQRVSNIETYPAPTNGLNDLESIASMDPASALVCLNWFPGQSSLEVRPGYRKHTSGFTGNVKTLMCYSSANAQDTLFAATDLGIFDITLPGTPGTNLKALTNGRMSYTNYANISGNYLVAVNGVDKAKLYNGTTWVDYTTVLDTPDTPSEIKGIDTEKFIYVHSFKKRLWFVERSSTTAWYLPTDATGGEAKPFYLGSVFMKGGFLESIFTWSLDSGDGLDDVILFLSSKGEIAIYQGNDPDNAATFQLSSVYCVGAFLGNRSVVDFGGDVALLTTAGAVTISSVVGGTQALTTNQDTLTKNISKTLSDMIRQLNHQPGWEFYNVPPFQMLFIVIPSNSGLPAVQFVMNTVTGKWCTFNYPMLTMVQCHFNIYFSDTLGNVWVITGDDHQDSLDENGLSGSVIVADIKQAYNYFGQRGVNKHYNLVRPLFVAKYPPGAIVKVSVDFAPSGVFVTPVPPPNAPTDDVWDLAIWDAAIWSPEKDAQMQWMGVDGLGYCASFVMRTATNIETEFVSVDWVYDPASSL